MGPGHPQAKAGLIWPRFVWEDGQQMKIALKVLSGPLKDNVFAVKEGLTLGRQGEIKLEDAKVSSLHARIVRNPAGHWMLQDNNSKNGIRSGGEKVAQVDLTPGAKFYIGDSEFMVVEVKPSAKAKPAKNQRYWHELLSELLDKNMKAFQDRPRNVSPLEPALVLEFVRGVQVASKWVLGFGPRKIGSASIDLPIWEPGAPATCFEIIPGNDGLVFKTAHSDIVLLNGSSVDSQVLHMGDTIRIMDTIIEVDFAE